MEYSDGKIYRLVFFILTSTLLFSTKLFAENADTVGYKVRFPFYEKENDLPSIILTADEARPIGIRVELKGVKLRWIGEKITETKGIVTTPFAVYNQSSLRVTGDKEIKYRSDAMDLDGIGFDIDQLKQILYIRNKVKVILKHPIDKTKKTNVKMGKISIEKTLKGVSVEKIKPFENEKEKNLNPKKKQQTKRETGNSMWWWLISMFVVAVVIIRFIIKRNKKRISGKIDRKVF